MTYGNWNNNEQYFTNAEFFLRVRDLDRASLQLANFDIAEWLALDPDNASGNLERYNTVVTKISEFEIIDTLNNLERYTNSTLNFHVAAIARIMDEPVDLLTTLYGENYVPHDIKNLESNLWTLHTEKNLDYEEYRQLLVEIRNSLSETTWYDNAKTLLDEQVHPTLLFCDNVNAVNPYLDSIYTADRINSVSFTFMIRSLDQEGYPDKGIIIGTLRFNQGYYLAEAIQYRETNDNVEPGALIMGIYYQADSKNIDDTEITFENVRARQPFRLMYYRDYSENS